MNKKNIFKSLSGMAGLFAILGILIAFNIVWSSVRLRKDLTEDQLYTLSEGTREMMGSLSRDVTLKFYFSKSIERVPVPLKQYAQRVTDLLREYQSWSRGRVFIEHYDPAPDSDEEEWAQRYGLTGQPMGLLGGPSLYLGVVAVSGKKEAALPFLSPGEEAQLEYLVTRLIDEVTTLKKNKIAVMSSLPVMGGSPALPFGSQPPAEPWIFVSELQKQYDVVAWDEAEGPVPDEIDTLIVIHPGDLAEKALFALDQFVLRGGRLLAFFDPFCVAEQENSPQGASSFMTAGSDLNGLTKAWGFEMDRSKVVADFGSASKVSFGNGSAQHSPGWLSLRNEAIEREEIVTGSLDLLMLPFAGALQGEPEEGLTVSTLLQTSEETSEIETFMALNPSANYTQGGEQGRKPLAIRLQGTFKPLFLMAFRKSLRPSIIRRKRLQLRTKRNH